MIQKYIKIIKGIIKRILDMFNLSEFASTAYHYMYFLFNIKLHYKNYRFRKTNAVDGMPLPPPYLIFFVGGFSLEDHYMSGVKGAKCIRNVLSKNGIDIEEFGSILDFGCGLGRILRQWKLLGKTRIYGTDYNKNLINWCKKAFPFATFNNNSLSPHLIYEDKKYDFIYAISVFTHFGEELQKGWMDELSRILKPGGYLLITVHGDSRKDSLSSEQIADYEKGKLVVVNDKYPGKNYCGAYHPEKYVREVLCKNLSVIDFVPVGSEDTRQDIYLIRKPLNA